MSSHPTKTIKTNTFTALFCHCRLLLSIGLFSWLLILLLRELGTIEVFFDTMHVHHEIERIFKSFPNQPGERYFSLADQLTLPSAFSRGATTRVE